MSEEDPGFAPPPFNVAEGLQKLQRELRALGLSERQGSFERRGQVLVQAALKEGRLQVSVAKRPAPQSRVATPRTALRRRPARPAGRSEKAPGAMERT